MSKRASAWVICCRVMWSILLPVATEVREERLHKHTPHIDALAQVGDELLHRRLRAGGEERHGSCPPFLNVRLECGSFSIFFVTKTFSMSSTNLRHSTCVAPWRIFLP